MNIFNNKNQAGFTLIELVVTVAILGILMTIGIPSLKSNMQNNSMTAIHNDLLSSLSLARNVAISRGSLVTVCKSNATVDACSSSGSWKDGWIVIPDKNSDGVIDSGAKILAVNHDLPKSITISATRNRITYNNLGYAKGFSTVFTFCDDRGNRAKKGMIVSNNGRARVAKSGDSLAGCP